MSQTPVFALSPVSFHGDTIFCITIAGQPFTPVKTIIENLGLAWEGQRPKLHASKDRWGTMIIMVPSESGIQQTLCMPVRKLPAFLATINPQKVRADLRPKIELYQAECDEALWNYWTKGRAERASAALPAPTLLPLAWPYITLRPDTAATSCWSKSPAVIAAPAAILCPKSPLGCAK